MMTGRKWISLLALPALLASGCIVDSRCYDDAECEGAKVCSPVSAQCVLECSQDEDCTAGIPQLCATIALGKRRCEPDLNQRVPAPGFCLKVVNPKSQYHNQDLCLSQLKGKVVMLYFAQLF